MKGGANELPRSKLRDIVFCSGPSFRARHACPVLDTGESSRGPLDTGFRRYDELAASRGE